MCAAVPCVANPFWLFFAYKDTMYCALQYVHITFSASICGGICWLQCWCQADRRYDFELHRTHGVTAFCLWQQSLWPLMHLELYNRVIDVHVLLLVMSVGNKARNRRETARVQLCASLTEGVRHLLTTMINSTTTTNFTRDASPNRSTQPTNQAVAGPRATAL